jgi:DNA (cytosine-5)-methyltransferase 1
VVKRQGFVQQIKGMLKLLGNLCWENLHHLGPQSEKIQLNQRNDVLDVWCFVSGFVSRATSVAIGLRMHVLDLFSGIGGFSLGLERAGMRTVAFCESDPFCQRVLRRHWPDVPIWGDVRTLTGQALADAGGVGCNKGSVPRSYKADKEWERTAACRPSIDLICGGFPCQPVSVAGKRTGQQDDRWLWPEFARLIGEIRPRWVVAENVSGLLSIDAGRTFGGILRDLASVGMSVEWHCIPACAVGAPHRRDRVWIIAHASSDVLRDEPRRRDGASRADTPVAGDDGAQEYVADAERTRLAQRQEHQLLGQCAALEQSDWWLVEPDVGRVAHRVPARVHRLRALGNSLVPQIAEIIGRAIMNTEAR